MTERILAVDDEKGIADLLDRVLVREGFDVVTATDGKRAKDVVRTPPPALVVLDLMLPELAGIEALEVLRAADGTRSISPTLTAFRPHADVIRARGGRSREALPGDVWGYDAEALSRTVDSHVRRLRNKLGIESNWIGTARRRLPHRGASVQPLIDLPTRASTRFPCGKVPDGYGGLPGRHRRNRTPCASPQSTSAATRFT